MSRLQRILRLPRRIELRNRVPLRAEVRVSRACICVAEASARIILLARNRASAVAFTWVVERDVAACFNS